MERLLEERPLARGLYRKRPSNTGPTRKNAADNAGVWPDQNTYDPVGTKKEEAYVPIGKPPVLHQEMGNGLWSEKQGGYVLPHQKQTHDNTRRNTGDMPLPTENRGDVMPAQSRNQKHYNSRAFRKARIRLRGLPCIYCGRPSDTVEHRTPVVVGGSNQQNNLAPACAACNYSRGAKLGNERRRKRERNRRYL